MNNIILALLTFFLVTTVFLTRRPTLTPIPTTPLNFTPTASQVPTGTPVVPTTSAPKPLSFTEMNNLYGPCATVPTLMYHHIEDYETAKKSGYQNLSVSVTNFTTQMTYLKSHGYNVIGMSALINFFNSGLALPVKPLLLTFDDGYADFYTHAYSILKAEELPATLFTPTGLVNNPGYVTWNQLTEMTDNGILVANHTWSHKTMTQNEGEDDYEIKTADTQLADRGLNSPKVFAYPFGTISSISQKELQSDNYQLAFTTQQGRVLCAKRRLVLPRIRIGNTSLSYYGL